MDRFRTLFTLLYGSHSEMKNSKYIPTRVSSKENIAAKYRRRSEHVDLSSWITTVPSCPSTLWKILSKDTVHTYKNSRSLLAEGLKIRSKKKSWIWWKHWTITLLLYFSKWTCYKLATTILWLGLFGLFSVWILYYKVRIFDVCG